MRSLWVVRQSRVSLQWHNNELHGISNHLFPFVHSTICSDADQRKHQSFASLAFASGIHWSPVDSPHKGSVTWKIFLVDAVIKWTKHFLYQQYHSKQLTAIYLELSPSKYRIQLLNFMKYIAPKTLLPSNMSDLPKVLLPHSQPHIYRCVSARKT